MNLTRRSLTHHGILWLTAGLAARAADSPNPSPEAAPGHRPLVVSTWPFGKPANEAALKVLLSGGSHLDAVEAGIKVTEADQNPSVGLGGIPNAAGVVQLDACLMVGPGHRAGSVAALEGIVHPISAARLVMEKTPHVMMVGEGARLFALEQGLASVPVDSAAAYAAWQKKRAESAPPPSTAEPAGTKKNHDTIALLVLDAQGDIAGGCSTSGWGGKLPGRVGDSPLIGGGLYVDNEVGAAGATGLGENILRYCGSFQVVELMRQGLAPEAACLEVVRRIAAKDPKGRDISVNFIAIDKSGRCGAAGSASGFQFAVTTTSISEVRTAPGLGTQDIGPVGGNRREEK